MQNKTSIWVFTILFAIACLWQLSFTFITSSVEKSITNDAMLKVDSIIGTDKELSAYSKDTLLNNYTNEIRADRLGEKVFMNWTYSDVRKWQINLGLDLQGGMNVTLEVSLVDLVKNLASDAGNENFNKAIALALENQKASDLDFITLFGQAFSQVAPNDQLVAIFHSLDNKEMFPMNASNEDILETLSIQAKSAIANTEKVLRKRIDNLGVVQPKIQRLDGERILVELPGVKDKKRVRKILQGTAKLEFWETYDNAEVGPKFEQVNAILKKEAELKGKNTPKDSSATKKDGLASTAEVKDTTQASTLDAILGSKDSDTSAASAMQAQSEEKNPLYDFLIPNISQRDGKGFWAQGPVVGYSNIRDVEKVNAILQRDDIKKIFPQTKFCWDSKGFDSENGKKLVQLYAIQVNDRDGKAPMEGDVVTDARREPDPNGRPGVGVSMNSDGTKAWKTITKENVGKSIAIVLDDLVYSAPNVQGEIAGGRTSITGNFSVEEADDLANVLKAGKLPAPSRIVEEAVVGPTLGQSNINSGFGSFGLALVLILIYMVFYYNKAGGVADIALIVNMFFIVGILASIGATLTLPGIAGIILTIGMSVDANVLIFERIREEMGEGKGLKLAIDHGYKNAYSSIIDANLTTLLTGFVLLLFGTGPIQGFATTLIIGILTSLFCAIVLTRLIFEWMLDKGGDIKFSSKLTENVFKNANYGFVKRRKLFYTISGLIIIAGIGSLAVRGLDYGVDFTGGRKYQVRFQDNVDITKVAGNLSQVFISDQGLNMTPEVKTYGTSNQVVITTKYLINEKSEDVAEKVVNKLEEGLSTLNNPYEIVGSQMVGATIADDIAYSALYSIVFALIIIFLYIVFRFRKWQYGLGALFAMFHDVIIVLSLFSIFYGILPFSLEIDQAFIAAILTVVGYSINDTVVVFDRIREHLERFKRQDRKTVINGALNSTLSRTINTSVSTFIVLLMIFIFGGEVIRGFVFALMVGVVVGTYSSLFIATPVVVDLDKSPEASK